ncbi:hypothetical protein NC653_015976 [Populus alba x Populus x berolinensis]|uniref:Uncharacterized protein n=1 Tax=Populus alba x Populus x berolinensis TaxID=444605 RepID=A0AAD6QM30_9ROSI|nr:hypothetical protein NC653_015976 [Populus alba x Populus x berolinensis]
MQTYGCDHIIFTNCIRSCCLNACLVTEKEKARNIAQTPPGWQRSVCCESGSEEGYYKSIKICRCRSQSGKSWFYHHGFFSIYLVISFSNFSGTINHHQARDFAQWWKSKSVKSLDFAELQLGKPALLPPPSSPIQSSASPSFDRPVKKKARTQSKQNYRTANPVCNQDEAKVEEVDQSRNSGSDL